MTYIHITVLLIGIIFCFVALGIINVTSKTSRLKNDTDFFHDFYEKKKLEWIKTGFKNSVNIYFIGMAVIPIVIGVLFFAITGNSVISVLGAAFGVLVPEVILKVLSNVNDSKFDERYARALQQLSSSLKAGMSILESVHDVTECRFIHESIRNRFATMALDMEMGVSVSDAFHRFADLTNSKDARDVAIAIDVQNEVGGHEAEVIEEITANIQRRIMLRKEVKSVFAGTTSMVWIMDGIPILTLIFYLLVNKSALEFFTGSFLHLMILIGIIFCFIAGSALNHYLLNKTIKGE